MLKCACASCPRAKLFVSLVDSLNLPDSLQMMQIFGRRVFLKIFLNFVQNFFDISCKLAEVFQLKLENLLTFIEHCATQMHTSRMPLFFQVLVTYTHTHIHQTDRYTHTVASWLSIRCTQWQLLGATKRHWRLYLMSLLRQGLLCIELHCLGCLSLKWLAAHRKDLQFSRQVCSSNSTQSQ